MDSMAATGDWNDDIEGRLQEGHRRLQGDRQLVSRAGHRARVPTRGVHPPSLKKTNPSTRASMAGGREIKTKIKSVQNTRKVTRALEMVSASKIRKAQDRMKASRPYARR
jgi:hypothetical protein